jgi:hypothetical protein
MCVQGGAHRPLHAIGPMSSVLCSSFCGTWTALFFGPKGPVWTPCLRPTIISGTSRVSFKETEPDDA